MSKLLRTLARSFSLMVSLPQNDPSYAQAAVQAGAHSIKVHLNCHHFASGTTFGTWRQEESRLREILSSVDVPVGIVTGEETQPSPDDLQEIVAAGFDFWDLFAKFTPPSHFRLDLGRMVAVDSAWTPEFMQALVGLGVQVIEGSVIPRGDYRSALNLVDLANYSRLVRASGIPVLIPTQKAIKPEEVASLRQVGAAGLTIGAVVTGLELGGLRGTTERFAEAIARLPY